MDRRSFISKGLMAGAAVAVAPTLLSSSVACGRPQLGADGRPESKGLDAFMSEGARVMWIAAHPDDECFCGSILARASIHYGNPLQFVLMTRGDGGECCRPQGCEPDLATVRAGEMQKVADLYRGGLAMESYFNAPLPVESFPKRHVLHGMWKEHRDPMEYLVGQIRAFKPDLVLTFEPTYGATGHPEHQLTSRLAFNAVRLAADPAFAGEAPHKVERTYFLLNRFWLLRLAGAADPGPVSEVFDATVKATDVMSCVDFMVYATRLHETQANDMGTVRKLRFAFNNLSLRRVDPFTQSWDPDEPA
ncbi:PIG-L family deacetylase [Myxococcota bacterium]|nr:PIG-L family deacetylase [Myxococcota bacterium]